MLWVSTPTPASAHSRAHDRRPPVRFDQQLPRAIVETKHCVRCIAEQVQDDLLELDPVSSDDREIFGEVRLKDYPVPLKITQRQRNHLPRQSGGDRFSHGFAPVGSVAAPILRRA